jgi:ABC-2 type transport system ATP-binding protein
MDTRIEIKNLTKKFGSVTAVDDVSFEVGKGEVLGFLGPNGAGKSTTMKMVTGFLSPTRGSVLVGGDDITRRPLRVKRRIGYLPEGAPAYPDMTPAGFLDFVADVRGLRGEAKRNRLAEVVENVNLGTVLHQPIDTLSKGFKRRVGLAQSILHDPEVLVMDEPTDGLDPNQKHEVRELIRAMAAEKVIVLSTHILEEVHAVCTRAIIIAGGRVVADQTPAELEARSQMHNAVTLTVKGVEDAQVRSELERLQNVSRVRSLPEQPGFSSFRIQPKGGSTVAAAISHLALERRWEVEQLQVHRGQLDEVFRTITTEAASALT